MTGYAQVRRTLGQGEISVTVRTVNHRALDLHLHLPPALQPLENKLRSAAKGVISRGHVQVSVTLAGQMAAKPPEVNEALAEAYIRAYRDLSVKFNLPGEPDLNAALRLPGAFAEQRDADRDSELEATVLQVLEEAFQALNEVRIWEGGELAQEIGGFNASLARRVKRMMELREAAVPAFQSRLAERLAELLKGAPGLEPQRLAQEAALLADRSDVSEELARLRIHSRRLEELLEEGGEAGKKLDFVLQEINREANTVLSKSSGIGEPGREITELALEVKADIERMREQALNLE